MEELDQGLWRFTARHPDWHPAGFGDEVAGFALRHDEALVLVDPLVDNPGDLDALDALVEGRVTILITIPYHVRSAADLAARWDRVQVLGPPAAEKKLPAGTPFRGIAPGEALPHGVEAFPIGKPRRQEQPLYLPWARALAFGDAVVGAEGGLRVWSQGERTERWYRERFRPTVEPLAQLDVERVLVTHGPPVLRDGARELANALDAGLWDPPKR